MVRITFFTHFLAGFSNVCQRSVLSADPSLSQTHCHTDKPAATDQCSDRRNILTRLKRSPLAPIFLQKSTLETSVYSALFYSCSQTWRE